MNFSYKGNGVKNFWVDKNGVFWLEGETKCYKVSSGSFEYQYVKAIYEDSKNIPVGQATIGNVSDKTWLLVKKWLKEYDQSGENLC